jgi:FAD/FMN-containing dehydrogenase
MDFADCTRGGHGQKRWRGSGAGGILLSLARMNHLLDVDADNLIAVAEPGVVCQDLQKAAWNAGLFYPPDPASLDTCSVGGNVAENAGGPRAFRYGVTREYVLGMEVVTMGGSRFEVGTVRKGSFRLRFEGSAGGSEGTLALFTKSIFKLIPQRAPAWSFYICQFAPG